MPEKNSCDGRVVKALDLKSNGIFPRRFEPYSQRDSFYTRCIGPAHIALRPCNTSPENVLLIIIRKHFLFQKM